MISDELYEQLKLWLADATSTFPSHNVRHYGLCSWVDDFGLIEEMQAFWREQGLNGGYPFDENKDGINRILAYDRDYAKHLNPRRLAWVRERIAEYEHTLAMHEEAKRT